MIMGPPDPRKHKYLMERGNDGAVVVPITPFLWSIVLILSFVLYCSR